MAAQCSSIRAARSRVSASCASNASRKLRLFHVSAYRAARFSITGPIAASMIGGRGDCTGRGFITASLIV